MIRYVDVAASLSIVKRCHLPFRAWRRAWRMIAELWNCSRRDRRKQERNSSKMHCGFASIITSNCRIPTNVEMFSKDSHEIWTRRPAYPLESQSFQTNPKLPQRAKSRKLISCHINPTRDPNPDACPGSNQTAQQTRSCRSHTSPFPHPSLHPNADLSQPPWSTTSVGPTANARHFCKSLAS